MDFALFAQQPFGPAQGGNPPPSPVEVGVALLFYGAIIAVALTVHIFFLLSLSRCFKQISPRNREMEPGQVWLNLIPVFGFVWMILTIIRLSSSLKNEYWDRGLREDGDFGQLIGIFYLVTGFCGCISFVLWIIYWVKIAGYTRTLMETAGRRRSRRQDEYDDDDDYRDDDYR